MKRFRAASACLLLFFALFFAMPAIPARADVGPKPSVQIDVRGLPDGVCYGTLLSETEWSGPHSVWNGDESARDPRDLGEEIWTAFQEYEDEDGYFFLQIAWRVDETNSLRWGYYPPHRFKVLLYFPESGAFAVSDVCERYAFDSYFTVRLSDGAPASGETAILRAQRSYDYSRELFGFLMRVLLTVAIELLIALAFCFSRRQLSFVLTVNLLTQILLNAAIGLAAYRSGAFAAILLYIAAEIGVFLIEAILYAIFLPRRTGKKRRRAVYVFYALVANAASFGAGWALAFVLPSIF